MVAAVSAWAYAFACIDGRCDREREERERERKREQYSLAEALRVARWQDGEYRVNGSFCFAGKLASLRGDGS